MTYGEFLELAAAMPSPLDQFRWSILAPAPITKPIEDRELDLAAPVGAGDGEYEVFWMHRRLRHGGAIIRTGLFVIEPTLQAVLNAVCMDAPEVNFAMPGGKIHHRYIEGFELHLNGILRVTMGS